MRTKYILGESTDKHGPFVALVDVGFGTEDDVQHVVWEWRDGGREKCWADARRASRTLDVVAEVVR